MLQVAFFTKRVVANPPHIGIQCLSLKA